MGPLIVEDSKGFTATWGDFSIRFRFKVDETSEETAVVPYQRRGALSSIASGAITLSEYTGGAGFGGAAAGFAIFRASTILSQRVIVAVVAPFCTGLGAVGPLQIRILEVAGQLYGPAVASGLVGAGAGTGAVTGLVAVYAGRNFVWPATYWVGTKVARAAASILGRVGNWILVIINEKIRSAMGGFITGSHAHLLTDGVQTGEA